MLNKQRQPRRSAGFTLIEVATSLTIMSVLMLGLSSAIVIASHAIPDPTGMGVRDQQIIDVLNILRDDIRDAEEFEIKSDASRTQVKIDLNDAGGLGATTKVEYNYYTEDDELYRKVDGIGDLMILGGVSEIKLTTTVVNAKPAALHMVIKVPDSIQKLFEVHAVVPQEPELK